MPSIVAKIAAMVMQSSFAVVQPWAGVVYDTLVSFHDFVL